MLFFFNDTATTEIYTLSLHDALPICDSSSPGPAHNGALGYNVGECVNHVLYCRTGLDSNSLSSVKIVTENPHDCRTGFDSDSLMAAKIATENGRCCLNLLYKFTPLYII